MSILIKGMKMPKDCPMCPMAHYNALSEFTGCKIGKRFFDGDEMNTSTRPSWCPLTELPPHGRLIDADALRQEWLDNGQNVYIYDTNDFLFSIDDAPAIIEAEVEE